MPKATVWCPVGTFVVEFSRPYTPSKLTSAPQRSRKSRAGSKYAEPTAPEKAHLDRCQNEPKSRHLREWAAREKYVTLRLGIARPGTMIVDRVFDQPGEGRVAIRTNAPIGSLFQGAPPAESTLECEAYEVRLLSALDNLDLLARASQLQRHTVLPPDPKSHAALQESREEILRELEHDETTTKMILWYAQPTRRLYNSLPNAAIVKRALEDLLAYAWKNAEKLSARCTDGNWKGKAAWQIKRNIDRVLRELAGARIRDDADDAPWKKGQALLAALQNESAAGGIEQRIAGALNCGLIDLGCKKGREVQSLFNQYMHAKQKYATAHYWIAYRELWQHLGDRETPEQRWRTIMALLRVIDRRVADRTLDFKATVRDEVRLHLAPDFPWEPTHGGDKHIFDSMSLQLNPATGQIVSNREVGNEAAIDCRPAPGPSPAEEGLIRLERILFGGGQGF